MKERIHNLAAAQLGVDPDSPHVPGVTAATLAAEAPIVDAPAPEPNQPAVAEVPLAPAPSLRRVMPHADALGEAEIILTVDERRPPATPALDLADEVPSQPIMDFRALLVLVVILLLAGLMMYAINRSRF